MSEPRFVMTGGSLWDNKEQRFRESGIAVSDVKAIHREWLLWNRVYYYLRQQGAPREAMVLVNNLAAELFEEMFKEAA